MKVVIDLVLLILALVAFIIGIAGGIPRGGWTLTWTDAMLLFQGIGIGLAVGRANGVSTHDSYWVDTENRQ